MRDSSTQSCFSFLRSFPRRSPAVQLPKMPRCPWTRHWLMDTCSYTKSHKWFSCNMTCWFIFSLLHFKRCIEPYSVFLFSCVSLWDAERSQDSMKQSSAVQPREPRQPKTYCKFAFPARHFWSVGTFEMFHNELKSSAELFWNSKRLVNGAHAKSETVEVFGSLCNV